MIVYVNDARSAGIGQMLTLRRINPKGRLGIARPSVFFPKIYGDEIGRMR